MAQCFTVRRLLPASCSSSQQALLLFLRSLHFFLLLAILNFTEKKLIGNRVAYGFTRVNFSKNFNPSSYEISSKKFQQPATKAPHLMNAGQFNCRMYNEDYSVKVTIKQNYTAKLKRSSHVTVYDGYAPGLSNKIICHCSTSLEIKCTGGLVEFPSFDQHQSTFELLPANIFSSDKKHNSFRQNIEINLIDKLVYRVLNVNKQFISSLNSYQFYKTKFQIIMANHNQIGNDISEDSFVGLEDTLQELHLGACRLKQLPVNLLRGLNQLQSLYIWGNLIEHFSNGFFLKAKNLRELVMWGNRIEHLDNNTLAGLWSLKRLELDRNSIEHLSSLAFRHLIELEVLTLSGNRIKTIHSDTFSFMSRLKILVLDNNQLKNLFPGAFNSLMHLTLLSLNSNEINHMPEELFQGLKSLTQLWISKNLIHSLRGNAFLFLKYLQDLNLSNNNLTNLPDKLFWATTRLRHLTFDFNKLSSVARCLFPKKIRLKSLSLIGNEIKCDCKSEWMVNLCTSPFQVENKFQIFKRNERSLYRKNVSTNRRNDNILHEVHRFYRQQQHANYNHLHQHAQMYSKPSHNTPRFSGTCFESSSKVSKSYNAKNLGINHLCWPLPINIKNKCHERSSECLYE